MHAEGGRQHCPQCENRLTGWELDATKWGRESFFKEKKGFYDLWYLMIKDMHICFNACTYITSLTQLGQMLIKNLWGSMLVDIGYTLATNKLRDLKCLNGSKQ